MAENDLVAYIKDRRKEGMSDDKVKTILQNAGYAMPDIEAGLRTAGPSASATGAPASAAPSSPMPGSSPVASTTPTAAHDFPASTDSVLAASAQSQPQAPAQASAPVQNPKAVIGKEYVDGGIGSKIKVALFSLLGILIVGGGAYAAYMYFGPPSPQKVIAAMLQNGFSSVHSLHESTDLNVSVSVTPPASNSSTTATNTNPALGYASEVLGSGPVTFSLSANASGSFDWSDAKDPLGDLNFTVMAEKSGGGQNGSISAGAEVRIISSTTYAELTQAPQLGLFDLSPFVGKWVSVPMDSSTLQAVENQASASVSNPFSFSTLSDANKASLMSALAGAVEITKTLPSEMLDGVSTYHYAYDITKPGLVNLLATVNTIAHVSSSVSAEMTSGLADALDAVQGMSGELWIGKSDYYPRQISFSFSFATTTGEYGLNGTIDVTSTLSEINQPQNIVAPAGAVDLQQLFSSSFGSLMESTATPPSFVSALPSQQNGRDAR